MGTKKWKNAYQSRTAHRHCPSNGLCGGSSMPASVVRREKMSNCGWSEQSLRAQARPEKDVSKPVLLYDPSCHEAKQLERFGQVGAQKEDDERFRPRCGAAGGVAPGSLLTSPEMLKLSKLSETRGPEIRRAKDVARRGQAWSSVERRSAHKPGCVQQTGYREAKDVGPALLSSSSGQRSLASDDDKQPPEQGSSSTNGHFTRPSKHLQLTSRIS